MNKPLHERLAALHEFLSPPCANALSPPALELLEEAVKALTPPAAGERAPTLVEMPWPSLHAGMRLVTGAYPRAVVAKYGDERAAERDAYWRIVLAEQRPTLPPLDDTLRDILGRICFTLIPLVHALRAAGHEIAHKAEDEQAAAIHWMLGHYFTHGADWRTAAAADLDRMKAQYEAENNSGGLATFVITGVEVKSA